MLEVRLFTLTAVLLTSLPKMLTYSKRSERAEIRERQSSLFEFRNSENIIFSAFLYVIFGDGENLCGFPRSFLFVLGFFYEFFYRLEALFADVVLDLAGVDGGGLFVNAEADKEAGQQRVALVHSVCNLRNGIGVFR